MYYHLVSVSLTTLMRFKPVFIKSVISVRDIRHQYLSFLYFSFSFFLHEGKKTLGCCSVSQFLAGLKLSLSLALVPPHLSGQIQQDR